MVNSRKFMLKKKGHTNCRVIDREAKFAAVGAKGNYSYPSDSINFLSCSANCSGVSNSRHLFSTFPSLSSVS